MDIQLRPADQDDMLLIWRWANDLDVRKNAFSTDFISWESHVPWFLQKLASQQCTIYVGILDDIPIGQVRFDLMANHLCCDYMIDISIDLECRERGIGTELLRKAICVFTKSKHVRHLVAKVKKGNILSMKIFEKNHFVINEIKTTNDVFFYELIVND